MIEHVYRRAARRRASMPWSSRPMRADRAGGQGFGGIVRMTRSTHRTGTDRIAEVAAIPRVRDRGERAGRLPLIEPRHDRASDRAARSDPGVQMSTLRRPITDPADRAIPTCRQSRRGPAMAMRSISRGRHSLSSRQRPDVQTHRAVRLSADVSAELTSLPQTPLETAESLEQLRALEHGFRIRAVETLTNPLKWILPRTLSASGGASPSARAHEAA